MIEFRLLDTGALSAAENMALDHILLEEVASGASPLTLRFLQFTPHAALVGYNQDVRLEIRTDFCRDAGVSVNRRITGGGTLLFQESALGWEIFGHPGEPPFPGKYDQLLEEICSAAALALRKLGTPAMFRPRNDIEVNGRKISGTGGAMIRDGFMFQGTLLIKNEIELFLKCLRVPVEKLKKREIESLLDRICFLDDVLPAPAALHEIKSAYIEAFSEAFGLAFTTSGLTATEERRMAAETPFFESDAWVDRRRRPESEGHPLKSVTQTAAGVIRVNIWTAPGGRRIRQSLIVGDFFTVPQRCVNDLEAALVGLKLDKGAIEQAIRDFFAANDGRIIGASTDEICAAVVSAVDRLALADTFSIPEANDLLFVNLQPYELAAQRAKWLLLPYCSKDLDCPYRLTPGCDECGGCEIGRAHELARAYELTPITIQSFEHLMETLEGQVAGEVFVGSCCEAFFAKHQAEMIAVGARGALINLDSTTCYDLGKGTAAYKGVFDNKTCLNEALIEKTVRYMNGRPHD